MIIFLNIFIFIKNSSLHYLLLYEEPLLELPVLLLPLLPELYELRDCELLPEL